MGQLLTSLLTEVSLTRQGTPRGTWGSSAAAPLLHLLPHVAAAPPPAENLGWPPGLREVPPLPLAVLLSSSRVPLQWRARAMSCGRMAGVSGAGLGGGAPPPRRGARCETVAVWRAGRVQGGEPRLC